MTEHWPPSPDAYRMMLERRKILMAELLQIEIAALEARREHLLRPVKRIKPQHPAQEYLDEIASLNPKDPRIPELRLKAAAADAYGWSHKTAVEKVRRNAERRRTPDEDP
jgi:hypothetical protein